MNKQAKHNLFIILSFLLVVALVYTVAFVVAFNVNFIEPTMFGGIL